MTWGRVGLIGMGIVLAAGCGAATEDDAPDGQLCTLAACSDQVSISIPGESEALPPPLPEGEYEVELAYDGVSALCTRSWPGRVDFLCDPPLRHGVTFELGRSGETARRIKASITDATPASVSITVRHDGVVLVSKSFEPAYSERFLNGVECGVDCREAALEVAFAQ